MQQQQSHSPYALPFDIRNFYLLPVQWVQAVGSVGAFDSLHLLASTHQERSEWLIYPPDQPESYWLRNNPDGLPNLVSHPTYYAWLEQMWRQGWLVNCEAASPGEFTHSGCYRMTGWPEFDGQGFHYAPRSFVLHRWPRLFVQNGAGIRAALTGCFALLEKAEMEASSRTLETTASQRQLTQAAAQLLPQMYDADKTGQGFAQLVGLGLLTPVRQSGSRNNRWYRFRSDVFDEAPQWPIHEIAERCLLDSVQDAHWVSLIQAFLRYNYLLIDQAAELWQTIRAYDRWLVTAEDVADVLVHLQAKAGHSATSAKRILSDFEKSQSRAKRRYWVDSVSTRLVLTNSINRSGPIFLPAPARVRDERVVDTLQLCFERGPRLSFHDAQAELAKWSLWVSQDDWAWRVCPQIRADRYAISHHLLLPLDQQTFSLDREKPLRLFVEYGHDDTQVGVPIMLECRVRAFYSRA